MGVGGWGRRWGWERGSGGEITIGAGASRGHGRGRGGGGGQTSDEPKRKNDAIRHVEHALKQK